MKTEGDIRKKSLPKLTLMALLEDMIFQAWCLAEADVTNSGGEY